MKSANISDLRDRLSNYLRRVRRGETIIVLDRNTPVARIEPVARSHEDLPACYHQALKDGLVRPPRKRDDPLKEWTAPPKPKKPAGLVEALVEERSANR